MKIYSHDEVNDHFSEHNEITISADLKNLKNIREFFDIAILKFENENEKLDHVHLRDEMSEWNEILPDIIIMFEK